MNRALLFFSYKSINRYLYIAYSFKIYFYIMVNFLLFLSLNLLIRFIKLISLIYSNFFIYFMCHFIKSAKLKVKNSLIISVDKYNNI